MSAGWRVLFVRNRITRAIATRSIENDSNISNPRRLYKHLVRETNKLPEEAAKFYKDAIRRGFSQHVDETDPERIGQIIKRAVEDAKWIVNKYQQSKK